MRVVNETLFRAICLCFSGLLLVLLLLTDIEGIYKDYNDKSTFISTMNLGEAKEYIKTGVISGGMIPKTEACIRALELGARKTHIIDGRLPHSIILEIFTSKGIGTQVLQ